MPLYYLHVCNGNGFVEDEEGQELADLDAARAAAIHGARDIMSADIRRGELDPASFIEVEDEDHRYLFTLQFSEAIRIKDSP
jgi:Domain of unknown function (DUF6894)